MFNMKTLSMKTAEKGYTIRINGKNMGYAQSLPSARKKAVKLLKEGNTGKTYIYKVNDNFAIGEIWLSWDDKGIWASGNFTYIIYKDGSIGQKEQYMR